MSAKVECIIPMLTKAFGIQWAVQLARLEIFFKKKKNDHRNILKLKSSLKITPKSV